MTHSQLCCELKHSTKHNWLQTVVRADFNGFGTTENALNASQTHCTTTTKYLLYAVYMDMYLLETDCACEHGIRRQWKIVRFRQNGKKEIETEILSVHMRGVAYIYDVQCKYQQPIDRFDKWHRNELSCSWKSSWTSSNCTRYIDHTVHRIHFVEFSLEEEKKPTNMLNKHHKSKIHTEQSTMENEWHKMRQIPVK